MAKATKKKNRRLRKQIRKTVGALLMVSAIVVAALPVQDVNANPTDTTTPVKVAVVSNQTTGTASASAIYSYDSTVPCAKGRPDDEQVVYTSGDGIFQFVYMRPTEQSVNKVAVILGYNSDVRMDSSLTIPETLEGYRKYTENVSNRGYCLVSRNNSFLYYKVREQKATAGGALFYLVYGVYDDDGNQLEVTDKDPNMRKNDQGEMVYVLQEDALDNDNKPIKKDVIYKTEPIMEENYYPCYYEQRSSWQDIADADLYYYIKSSDEYVQAKTEDDYWKINANVAYIGAEKLKDDGEGGWELDGYITEPKDGVFANQKNITKLTIGNNILGISDYAFYNCATLESVTLANGLKTLGNGAFANCIRLQSCNIASNANIDAIGKDAFYNCSSLTSFKAPIGLEALGDCCFEGCSSLQTVDLCDSGNGAVALQVLGKDLFKGCSNLTSLEFPSTYKEGDLSIKMLDGCSSLQYVKVPNAEINFEGTADEFEKFKETVLASFYFEGPATSEIHNTASANSIAFKYLNQDLYELIKIEKDGSKPPKDVKVTYQVNSHNELVKFWIEKDGKPENVTIPETIGPYNISAIGAGSFNDNCYLNKITIPASVKDIGANAFKGCHNLNTVIFTDATQINSIGTDAFKTQVVTCTCGKDTPFTKNPELTFVGALYNPATGNDTVPFVFAMNGVSNINNGNQEKSFITCHSGWPTNIEVKYNYDPITGTGEAELQNYPKYTKDLKNPTDWLATLPYVTTANTAEYLAMVQTATTNYEAYKAGTSTKQPTQNEMDIINSALNIVIPKSVDSIKTGIFSGVDSEGKEVIAKNGGYKNTEIQSIVLNGVNEVDPYTFSGCTSLKDASVIGPSYIGDYAFDGCTALENATLGPNLTDTGKRPFKGCTDLTNINCLENDFSYSNGILYRNITKGKNTGKEIVECLEGRGDIVGSYSVGPDELSGVLSIKKEAFMDCDNIGKVDLSATTVDVIPVGCFQATDQLNSVVLPDTVKNIEADSFKDSKIRLLTIPGTQAYIAPDAFKSNPQQNIIFECIEDLTADRYAKEYTYINSEYDKVFLEHTVYFWDYPNYPKTDTKELFYKVKVRDGDDAVPPTTSPSHTGTQFNRWTDYTNIVKDTDVYPVFGYNTYAVKFVDWDASLIGEIQYIEEGRSAVPPAKNPERTGYTFKEWLGSWNNITEDRTIIATYTDNSSDASRHTVIFYDHDGTIISKQSVNDGEGAVEPKSPTRSGYTFIGWIPKDFSNVTADMNILANYEKGSSSNGGSGNGGNGGNSSATPTPTATNGNSSGNSANDVKKYTVSVSGGSGSGSYAAGDIVAINAYDMGAGQNFDKWTSSTAGVGFANPNASSTTFTMPATNVAITATYKTGSGTTTSSNGGSGSGSSSGGSSNNGSGTYVEVDRPGFSNTGLAGATVSGATDNFIVKVTEQQSATDAVIAALQARYGDLSRIKYFPMDISLYDSTGRTKIADTSGISVNITLPIPDEMIQYAGNNKAAAVSGGALEDLNVRFTTVDGVPCVNFTATHFSPYVIYVDTANLTEATIDATPKTGDPIHPKWFLALGLACISMILFFKRDKVVIRTKTA